MKTLIQTTLSFGYAIGLLALAADPPTQNPPPENQPAPTAADTGSPGAPPAGPSAPVPAPAAPEAAQPAPNPSAAETAPLAAPRQEATEAQAPTLPPLGPNELRLNFRNAPLESVLNYLSDAAGFIIVLPQGAGEIKGKVNMWSNQPVTKDEALDLLASALDQNGYALVQNDRTLTIWPKSDARVKDIPVKTSNRPEDIPRNDQIVTQIIPVKFINAVQLSRDLQSLKPDSATWSANEGGNSLIVTDTQANIRHLVEIVKALDTAISSVSSVRVFKLTYADAKSVATVIRDLFAVQDTARGGGANAAAARFFQQMRSGRGGGGGPGGFGGQGGDQAASSPGGGRAPTPRVVAVSEDRSNAVIVSAPEDQMAVIADTINQLDTSEEEITELKVFRLRFADAQETADLLTNLFADSTYGSSQNFRGGQIRFGGRFGGPFGGGFAGGGRGGSTEQSARLQKQTRVVAVPDLRTSSVVVSAARDLMKQIEEMIAELDSDPAKKQQVFVFDVQNTDPTQVQSILQSLFPTQTGSYNSNLRMNQNQAGIGNQLNNRATRNQNNMGRGTTGTRASGFGGGLTFGGQ